MLIHELTPAECREVLGRAYPCTGSTPAIPDAQAELPGIGRDQRRPTSPCLAGKEHVIGTDRFFGRLELATDRARSTRARPDEL